MGDWYWIGVTAGLGAACGIALAGALARTRLGLLVAAALGAGAGIAIGFGFFEWGEATGGGLGGVAGALGLSQVVRGALARGGTRGATGALVAGVAVVCAALAFVPALGYAEALLAPLLGLRLRRRGGTRFAGLRILARD
jgi:hypothetical protein